MGLAVSQSIMRDHNGEIRFEPGTGARFIVSIPIAATEALPKPEADYTS
jgi:signal transduction histidine kinase